MAHGIVMKNKYFFVWIFAALLVINHAQATSSNRNYRNYCISKCFATWNCFDDSGRASCEQSRTFCVDDCAKIPDDPPHISGGAHGAIAYDSNSGAWGLSDESPSMESAKSSALKYCHERGKNCAIIEAFANSCAAIAVGTDGAVGFGQDNSRRLAGMKAIQDCGHKTKSGMRCFLKKWHCYQK